MQFKGRLVTGVARGAYFIGLYSDGIKKATGMEPYPGTLNIDVGKTVMLKNSKMKIDRFRKHGAIFGAAWLTKCKVNGKNAYVIFPEKTCHPRNILEIISGEYLRDALKIKDGDEVSVIIER